MAGRRRRREASLEFWSRAVEAAGRAGREAAVEALQAWREAVSWIEERLDRVLAWPPFATEGYPAWEAWRASLRAPAWGVDSSRTRPVRLGFRLVSFISAAAVSVDPPGAGERGARVEYMRVEDRLLPEEAPLEKAGLELELDMFLLEARALDYASRRARAALFLDGPLVDPPGLSRSLEGDLAGKYEAYLESRASSIARALESGVIVVGFAKRVTGRMLASRLEEEGAEWAARVGDFFLALAAAAAARRRLGPGCDPPWVAATKPRPLDPSRAPDAPRYESLLEGLGLPGARVYYSLLVPGACRGNVRRPARVEFVAWRGVDSEEAALRAAGAVEAWLLEGAWVPEPVMLAHKACTIRRRESLKLLREAASRYALDALGDAALAGDLGEAFRG